VIAQERFSGFDLVTLYEYHHSIQIVEGLSYYFGGGAHISAFRSSHAEKLFSDDKQTRRSSGLDAIAGMEYVIKEVPLAISCDWKPTYDQYAKKILYLPVGISVRYYFHRN
jgi:hypothetical protein